MRVQQIQRSSQNERKPVQRLNVGTHPVFGLRLPFLLILLALMTVPVKRQNDLVGQLSNKFLTKRSGAARMSISPGDLGLSVEIHPVQMRMLVAEAQPAAIRE